MMDITASDAEPQGPWDGLCHDDRSPWNSLAFARLQRAFGAKVRYLLAEKKGQPVGALALWYSGSRRMSFLDSVMARTVRIPDEPAVPSGDREVSMALARAAKAEAVRLHAVEVTWRIEFPRLLTAGDLSFLGYRITTRGIGVLELPEGEGDLDELLARTARKQVRKARRDGTTVEAADGIGRLLPLLDLSFARSGLPPRDYAYVRTLQETLGAEVLVASSGGRDVAALLWARVGRVALNIFHGRADGDTHGASNLLHVEMFTRARRAGAEVVHTGDAGLPGERDPRIRGITHFKETMGFEIRPAYQGVWTPRPVAAGVRRAALGAWVRMTTSGRNGP